MVTNPLLTVILIAGNQRERLQRGLRALLAQDIADQIVIMVFDRADEPRRDLPELTSPNMIYEAAGRNIPVGHLQKRGLLAATTDVVAFIEEHVLVPPGWARESVRLHSLGYAGVTGVFVSGNPQYRWSRLMFSITYGDYSLSKKVGETTEIRTRNSSFIRSKILEFLDELEAIFNTDILIANRLIENGEKCYRADRALTHWNQNTWWAGWSGLRYSTQMYICNRLTTERWSRGRRLLRIGSVPFIPFVRGYRNYKQARVNGTSLKQFLADLPSILFLHSGSAVGMAAGLLFGNQDCEHRFADVETDDQRSD